MMKNLKFKLYRTLNLSKKTNAIFYYFPMDNRFLSRRTRHLSTSIDKNPEKNNIYSMADDNDRIKEELIYRYNKYSKKYSANFMTHLLDKLYNNETGEVSSDKVQRDIENLIMNEFDIFYNNNKKEYMSSAIENKLVPKLIRYMLHKEVEFTKHVQRLKRYHIDNDDNTKSSKLINDIFSVVDEEFMVNVCLSHTLLVHVYQGSDNDRQINTIDVSVTIGKKIVNRYFNILKEKYIKENDVKISYSEFQKKWYTENPEYEEVLDSSTLSTIGSSIITILTVKTDVLKQLVIKEGIKNKSILMLSEEGLGNKDERLLSLPTKLPMIVKPKLYTNNQSGGYLLNDDKYHETMFIEKKAYAFNSELSDTNKIYDMINNINSTPFRINIQLLDYLLENGDKYNLLLDSTVKHKYEELEKRTKYQENVYKAYNSKLLLQENILAIAQFYAKYSHIYFPVRLDQRGRLYCMPNFLNYQSNELSKALLLFSVAGIIKRNDFKSISYLKVYGANCYGGKISKVSSDTKLAWVDDNLDNILDYDNGILLNKAKNKLLFLAFCMEFKRFYEYYIDESLYEFRTYLPIQLDATCNGFQHMALLSNEDTLFKELNLIDTKSSEPPKDFYNFLLHKLNLLFEDKLAKEELIDPKTKGSYTRLNKFVWDRSYVKKAIMTIPYNASTRSMKKYVVDSLIKLDYNKEDGAIYSDNIKNTETVITDKDVNLLISSLMYIITNDFRKIKKLIKYLKNIASICNILEIPITWTLPTGLTIKQSYLETKSTTITPFMYSKTKLTLKTTVKDKFDKHKQVVALMPNLIHSLDASSLSLLFYDFRKMYKDEALQFFSVHDCFGTTSDKVFNLKTLLASVYTDIYSSDPYLYKFDKYILDSIENSTDYKLDRENRVLYIGKNKLNIHDVKWVTNQKVVSSKLINKIDSQYIVI